MLTRRVAVALVAAVALPSCADRAAVPVASPLPATSSPALPTPYPTPAGGKEFVHTAIAILTYPRRQGQLWVTVFHKQTATGVTVTAQYERLGACTEEAGGCPMLWRVDRTLAASQFTYDETLDRATLTDTLKSKPVSVTWSGFGDTVRQLHQNGSLLIEQRRAVGDIRWGEAHYVDPRDERKTGATLSRRVT